MYSNRTCHALVAAHNVYHKQYGQRHKSISFGAHVIKEIKWGASVFLIAYEILTAQKYKHEKPADRHFIYFSFFSSF